MDGGASCTNTTQYPLRPEVCLVAILAQCLRGIWRVRSVLAAPCEENRKSVKDLKVAWTFSMDSSPDAVNETTPRCTTASCSCGTSAKRLTRSTRRPARCSGSSTTICRMTTRRWAYDDRDGKVLWESGRLNDIPNAFPITYMVDGKQYIAMPAGDPGLQGNWVLNAAPELGAVRGSQSSVLRVWELP